MKKLLIASLALITVLTMSLTACGNDPQNNDDGGLDDGFISRDDGSSTGEGEETTGDAETTDNTTNSNNITTGTWVDKDDTVYVLGEVVNIRSAANKNSTLKGTVKMGDSLKRVRMQNVNKDGWSEITYNGETAYIMSAFLSTNQNEAVFEDCEETQITFDSDITSVWLRSAPTDTTEDTKANALDATTIKDAVVTKIAVNKSNTWAKVKYNDKTYYLGVSTFDGLTSSTPGGLG